MRKANLISAFIFIVLSIYVISEASHFPNYGGSEVTGPGFFPIILSIILIVLSVLLIITSIFNKDERNTGLFEKKAVKAYITILSLLIYVMLLKYVGFIILTLIFLFGLIRFYGMKNYIKISLSSIVATVSIYWIFKVLLSVPLPTGIFLS
ncbi:tripartite tricarboxylate transporter TctB family protein [Defluviitalea phaphyphila]|uniref:tripartite tricarboxylate transporter TctB family protein n=1 Tax=Defluviitalea phaphyphila TaxID=1473580 RepID=UPI000731DAE2|nr:tripartite tricarboxylate transporter TctB family protein [Defluviitalea phaphyphila]